VTTQPSPMWDVVADHLSALAHALRSAGQEPRLLVPGLTDKSARAIHLRLLARRMRSFLVCRPDESPSHPHEVTVEGMTAVRKSEFVFVVPFSVIATLPDSILGSGGVIRSPAFPAGWPWDDTGPPQLGFSSSVLPRLIQRWGVSAGDPQEAALKKLVSSIVEDLKTSPRRREVLMDEILGSFLPEGASVVDAFLQHCHIPWGSAVGDPGSYVSRARQLARHVLVRSERESDLRAAVQATAGQEFPELGHEEREQLMRLSEAFLDGLLGGSGGLLGLLALDGGLRCATQEDAQASQVLGLGTLERLFEVRAPVPATVSIENLRTNGGVVARRGERLMSRYGSKVWFDARYSTGDSEGDQEHLVLTVSRGRQRLVEHLLDESEGVVALEIDTRLIATYQATVNLSVQLRHGGEIVARAPIRAELFGQERPLVVCVGDELTPVDVGDEEPELLVDAPQHVYVGLDDETATPVVIADEREREVRSGAGVWRIPEPVDPHRSPGGLVHVEVSSGSGQCTFVLKLKTAERGRFTVYEEALTLTARGLKDSAGRVLDRFTGRESSHYPLLGDISPGRLRLARLARLFDDQSRGYLPVLSGSVVEPSEVPAEAAGSEIARWTEPTAALSEVASATLDPSLSRAVAGYADIRRAVIARITGRVDDIPADSVHPPYAYSPVFVEPDAAETERLLTEYLQTYREILHLVRPSMPWGTRFLATSLDSVASPDFGSRNWGVRLLSPWHPVVLTRRYLLERTLVHFARRHLFDHPELRVHALAGLLDKLLPARWLPSLERVTRAAVLLPSTDAGWLIAVTLDDVGRTARPQDCLARAATHVNRHLGLKVPGYASRRGDGIAATLRDFTLVHATARRTDLGFSDEFSLQDVAASLIEMFEGGDNLGGQLPGGVHAFVPSARNDEVSQVADALRGSTNTEEKLFLYSVEREKRPDVDIEFLGSTRRVSLAAAAHGVPAEVARSGGAGALLGFEPRDVIHTEVGWTGRTGCHEARPPLGGSTDDVGAALTTTVAEAQQLVADRNFQLSSPLELPSELRAPWIHTPGDEVDPALVRQFVRASQNGFPRVLWDYRVTFGNVDSPSFFLFSRSSEAVNQAISSLLPSSVASGSDVLSEMAELGIALTGESERTGRHARGCIGLVGAARVTNHLLGLDANSAGIVIPVDSFAALVGAAAEVQGSFTRRRTDLLLVRFWWSGAGESVTMSAVGVEAKFLSHRPRTDWILDSLDQAAQTVTRLRWLVREAATEAGLPVRAALAALFGFGLRLRSEPGDSVSQRAERTVQLALASGRLSWSDPVRMGLTVVTGPSSGTAAERRIVRDKGLLVTLVPDDWPGDQESRRLKEIRDEIAALFPSRPRGQDAGGGAAEGPPAVPSPEPESRSTELGEDEFESRPGEPSMQEPERQPGRDPSVAGAGATQSNLSPGGTQRRLSDEELEARYQVLLGAFHELELDVREVQSEGRIRETPSSVKFRIRPTIRSLRQVTNARTVEALSYALALQRDQVLWLYSDRGDVVVDVPKREEERYFVLASDLWRRWQPRRRADRLELPLGLDHDGSIVSVDFSSCAHLLVAGQTGSGKSKALETLICGGAAMFDPDRLRLVLVDGKRGVELGKFAALPHCLFPVGIDGPEAVDRLDRAVEEMERRNDLLRTSRTTNIAEFNTQAAPDDRLPWWLVILDEYADLQASGDSGPRLEQRLQRLGQLARAAGIHVVVSTQKPVVTVVTTVLKENLPARLAFRVTSAAGSRVILDEAGAEGLNGMGDGILRDLERSTRFQCAIVEPGVIASLLDERM
jgi:hypothetical protein